MDIRGAIKGYLDSLKQSIQRFPTTFAITLFIALDLVLLIYWESGPDEVLGRLLLALMMTGFADLFMSLLRERWRYPLAIQLIISLLICVGSYVVFKQFSNDYVILGTVGIIVALCALSMHQIYVIGGADDTLAGLIQGAVYAIVMASVVFSGLSLCLFAFNSLIYEFRDSWKLYSTMADVLYVVVAINVFLSFLPTKDRKEPVLKAYRTLINKIALILYLLLLIILYAYFIRIVLSWQLPSNRINLFSSLALLFFCGFYLSLQGETHGLAKKYLKICGFLMIPIMILQGLAIYERVSVYGLTIWRVLSLGCNVVALLFVVDAIAFRKVSWIFAGMAVVALAVCVMPLNAISMANGSQAVLFNQVLADNHLIQNGSVVIGGQLSQEDSRKLISACDYLQKHYGTLNVSQKKLVDEIFPQIQSMLITEPDEKLYRYLNCYSSIEQFDIGGYATMENIHFNLHNEECMVKGYNIYPYLLELYKEHPNDGSFELYYQSDNMCIYFTYVHLTIDGNDNRIVDAYGEGYLLEK